MALDQIIARISNSARHKTFYHFTDQKNLRSIREQGGILPMKTLRERGIVVPAPGGNDHSLDADRRFGMDAYVHLCFTRGHPMEWLARRDGRIETTAWLRIKPTILERAGVLVTAEVSNKRGVVPQEMEAGMASIDSAVIYDPYVWGPDIKARLDIADKYEVLVPCIVPLEYVENPDG
jgi:hypothetical protein